MIILCILNCINLVQRFQTASLSSPETWSFFFHFPLEFLYRKLSEEGGGAPSSFHFPTFSASFWVTSLLAVFPSAPVVALHSWFSLLGYGDLQLLLQIFFFFVAV
jgi:hypothetical protein